MMEEDLPLNTAVNETCQQTEQLTLVDPLPEQVLPLLSYEAETKPKLNF